MRNVFSLFNVCKYSLGWWRTLGFLCNPHTHTLSHTWTREHMRWVNTTHAAHAAVMGCDGGSSELGPSHKWFVKIRLIYSLCSFTARLYKYVHVVVVFMHSGIYAAWLLLTKRQARVFTLRVHVRVYYMHLTCQHVSLLRATAQIVKAFADRCRADRERETLNATYWKTSWRVHQIYLHETVSQRNCN